MNAFVFFAVISFFSLLSFDVAAMTVYSTDFDSLGLGLTEDPARTDQDGWRAAFHPGASLAESRMGLRMPARPSANTRISATRTPSRASTPVLWAANP